MEAKSNGFWTYKYLIDPLTSGLRRNILEQINPDSSVLDIACGTGSLLFDLAPRIRTGIGIDLNVEKIEQAKRLAKLNNIANITFTDLDALKLSNHFTEKFDYVVLSLAVHQFPEPLRTSILKQAIISGHHLIIADYSVPVPRNAAGLFSKIIERIAGEEHFNAYKSFVGQNGIKGLQKIYNLECISTGLAGYGVFTISKLKHSIN